MDCTTECRAVIQSAWESIKHANRLHAAPVDPEMERKAEERAAQAAAASERSAAWLAHNQSAVRDRELEELRAELNRVQQKACSVAEALRLNSRRLDAVLADRESERAARTAEEKRARAAEAVLARVRQMADHWEKQLPDVIRTPAVVSALRAALDRAELPEATEFR
jgi:chromosome segregation ATPase